MPHSTNALLSRHLQEAGWSAWNTARRVNDERGRRGNPTAYTATHVKRWKLGTVPDPQSRSVLVDLLSAVLMRGVTETDLGFPSRTPPLPELFPAQPDDAISAAAELWSAEAAGALPTDYHPGGYAVPAREWLLAWPDGDLGRFAPRRVGQTDVDLLWLAEQAFDEMQRRRGGGYARATLGRMLADVVAPLLAGGYRDGVGRQLFAAAGRLADIAGYCAFDVAAQGPAQRLFIHALRLARAAGDDVVAAQIFGDMARQTLYLGEAGEALSLARAGQRAAGDCASALARCAALEAQAHAAQGDHEETERAIDRARDALDGTDPDKQPPWLAYLTMEELDAEHAVAALMLGRPDETVRLAAPALSVQAPVERRTALLAASVARAHLRLGQSVPARRAMRIAEVAAAGGTSHRVREALQQVRAMFGEAP